MEIKEVTITDQQMKALITGHVKTFEELFEKAKASFIGILNFTDDVEDFLEGNNRMITGLMAIDLENLLEHMKTCMRPVQLFDIEADFFDEGIEFITLAQGMINALKQDLYPDDEEEDFETMEGVH